MARIKNQEVYKNLCEKAKNGDEKAKKMLINLPSISQEELENYIKTMDFYTHSAFDKTILSLIKEKNEFNSELDKIINDFSSENSEFSKEEKENVLKVFNSIKNDNEKHLELLKLVKNNEIDKALSLINIKKGE